MNADADHAGSMTQLHNLHSLITEQISSTFASMCAPAFAQVLHAITQYVLNDACGQKMHCTCCTAAILQLRPVASLAGLPLLLVHQAATRRA